MLPRLGSDRIMLTRGVTMEYGIALIDRAGKMCWSFYKLHKVECGRRVLALAIATVLRFLRADPFPPKPFGFLREPFAPPEASHLR